MRGRLHGEAVFFPDDSVLNHKPRSGPRRGGLLAFDGGFSCPLPCEGGEGAGVSLRVEGIGIEVLPAPFAQAGRLDQGSRRSAE